MKIGVSSTGTDRASMVDPRFGRCGYFAIIDTDHDAAHFVVNRAQDSGGGAGIAAAQQMIDEDVEVVLTGNLGPNAYNVLANAQIKTWRVSNVSIDQAVTLFQQAKLEPISEAGPEHFGMRQGQRGGF